MQKPIFFRFSSLIILFCLSNSIYASFDYLTVNYSTEKSDAPIWTVRLAPETNHIVWDGHVGYVAQYSVIHGKELKIESNMLTFYYSSSNSKREWKFKDVTFTLTSTTKFGFFGNYYDVKIIKAINDAGEGQLIIYSEVHGLLGFTLKKPFNADENSIYYSVSYPGFGKLKE